ncbi:MULTISPECIES: amidohydrolase family protein [Paraburkholderia]|uniref:Amidohydrolase family protein n=1 Tax=Paraburkholderia youngii TaxID=2782701 RepID=A0ABX2NW21_9BURK|nr:amidohydrolase family protein [Paraburkholderia youngii]NUX54745.1 amidohydrolase family protein [Paraburkholderia youngii]NVI08693.1 amidohydrolase family protein [Paraburkholderia youngii]
MKVDAHQHFWTTARSDYGWLTPDLAPLWRDFLPSDLAPLAQAAGVDKTIVVQAAPTMNETLYLLELVADDPLVGGVVGWVPMLDPDAPTLIERLAREPKFKGVRPMLQDLPDDDWIANSELDPAVAAIVRHDLAFDALVYVRHLPYLARFAARHAELRIVIDHVAKPRLPDGQGSVRTTTGVHVGEDWVEWTRWMGEFAEMNNVVCKLSGMVTEAAPGYADDAFSPYFAFLLSRFGAQRLMWGSDWPVLNLNGDYASWHACVERLSSSLAKEDRAAIFGETARSFYRL